MKKNILRVFLEIGLVLFIIIGFVLINEEVTEKNCSSFILRGDNNIFAYQVESLETEGDDLVIKGWFFEVKKVRNKDREVNAESSIGVVLYDLQSDEKHDEGSFVDNSTEQLKGILTKVTQEKRPEIDSYFACEYDYSECGFIAKVDKSKLDLDHGKYLIVLKQVYDEKYGIGVASIIDGKLEYIYPENQMELNVKDTDLDLIVSEGTCVASDPEFHMCVYQYGKKLYWIADKDYPFEADGSTFIQYQIDTTQFGKLPRDRVDNGNYFDYLGMNFESNEITNDINCGEYRVCTRDIPLDYSITYIVTGYHIDGKWIWQKCFRPVYSQLIG